VCFGFGFVIALYLRLANGHSCVLTLTRYYCHNVDVERYYTLNKHFLVLAETRYFLKVLI